MLKEFLGDAKIKSLQSDGYNVYMYLDDEMVEVEHICCLLPTFTTSFRKQRGSAYSILSSRPVSRSVATSATSSLTLFGSGTGDEGTMTILSGLLSLLLPIKIS